jgi:MFS family permease
MGTLGGGLTLGVALGAMAGGFLGRSDPLRPLHVGAAVAALAALVAWRALAEPAAGGEQRPTLARMRAALRANPGLLAPLAFSFVDRFTVGFYTTTLSLYLSRIHALSAPHIGILIFVFMLPFAALSYPFGRLAERRSPVWMLCGGSVAYGVGTACLPLAPVEALPALMAAIGVTAAVMFVPSLVVTNDLAPAEIRGTALGAFNAAGSLGFIVGPLTGGLVSESVAAAAGWEAGYRAAFALAGASQLLCVALALPFLARLVRQGRTR